MREPREGGHRLPPGARNGAWRPGNGARRPGSGVRRPRSGVRRPRSGVGCSGGVAPPFVPLPSCPVPAPTPRPTPRREPCGPGSVPSFKDLRRRSRRELRFDPLRILVTGSSSAGKQPGERPTFPGSAGPHVVLAAWGFFCSPPPLRPHLAHPCSPHGPVRNGPVRSLGFIPQGFATVRHGCALPHHGLSATPERSRRPVAGSPIPFRRRGPWLPARWWLGAPPALPPPVPGGPDPGRSAPPSGIRG